MKTTKDDFELFKSECEKWLRRFGLLEWRVTYAHKPLGESFAEILYNFNAKLATISLSTNWGETTIVGTKEDQVRLSAKHEVGHLLIGELAHIADCRFVTDGELEAAKEGLIHKLEKLISNENN